jgi:hypothetical protein
LRLEQKVFVFKEKKEMATKQARQDHSTPREHGGMKSDDRE